MVGVLLAIVVLVYLAASVAWSVFLRRYRKTRVRFIGVAVSFVLALIGTFITKSALSGSAFTSDTLIPALEANGAKELAELLEVSPAMYETTIGLASALIVPIVMLVLFVVFNFFAWIVYLLISLLRGSAMKEFEQSEDKPAYVLPVTIVLAVVQSLLVVFVWMVPIATYAKIGNLALNGITQTETFDDSTQNTLVSIQRDYVAPLDQNVAVEFFRLIGVGPISDSLSSFTVKGQNVKLANELEAVSALGCNAIRLSEKPLAEYGNAEKQTLNRISAAFDRSELVPILVAEIIHGATDAWKNEQSYVGVGSDVIEFDDSGLFDSFTTTLVDILHEDTADGNSKAIRADFATIVDLTEVLIDKKVFASVGNLDALIDTLAMEGVVEDMIVVIGSNNSMKRLIPEITNIGVQAIGTTLGMMEDKQEIYDLMLLYVAEGLNDARASSDRVEAVTSLLVKEFDSAGIALDSNVVEFFAEAMVDDLIENAGAEITSDDVRAFFAVYAWNAAQSNTAANGDSTQVLAGTDVLTESEMRDLLSGTVYEGKNIAQLKISGAGSLAVNASLDAESVLATKGLYSAATMNTLLVTVEDLMINSKEEAGKINSSNIDAEIRVLSSIFSAAAEVLLYSVDTDKIVLEDVSDAIGEILDSLVASPTYGQQKTAKLFTAILQSDTVRKSAGLDIKTATNLARRGSEGDAIDYRGTFKTLAKTVAVMDSMNKNSGKLDEAEITQLLETINPQSAGMIEEYITPERMETDYKMDEKQSAIAAPLISNTFAYLADNNVEDYEKEAKAINHVMSITMAARDSANDPEHNKSLLGDDGVLADQGATEEERAANIVDAFMASDAVAHSLATTPHESDPFELSGMMENNQNSDEMQTMKDAMADYYNKPGNATEENREKLTNLCDLFGLTDMDDIFGE